MSVRVSGWEIDLSYLDLIQLCHLLTRQIINLFKPQIPHLYKGYDTSFYFRFTHWTNIYWISHILSTGDILVKKTVKVHALTYPIRVEWGLKEIMTYSQCLALYLAHKKYSIFVTYCIYHDCNYSPVGSCMVKDIDLFISSINIYFAPT